MMKKMMMKLPILACAKKQKPSLVYRTSFGRVLGFNE